MQNTSKFILEHCLEYVHIFHFHAWVLFTVMLKNINNSPGRFRFKTIFIQPRSVPLITNKDTHKIVI